MDSISLSRGRLQTSRIGFGCASLMARLDRRESVRLLETALAAGITHFDVARSYGYGEAESAVGHFAAAAGRRDQVTIATKLGIAPPRRSRGLSLARAGAKRLVALAPSARKLVRRRAAAMVSSGNFSVEDARLSFETSLRELQTDYVDLLLLHDCEPDDVTPEILGFLRERVEAGQARAFGVATGRAEAAAILAADAEQPLLAQVPYADDLPGSLREAPGGLILHSLLRGRLDELDRAFASGGLDPEEWSQRLGLDVRRTDELGDLLFRAAAASNPGALLLFSSGSAERIGANARLLDSPAEPPERTEALAALRAAVRGPATL